MDGHTYPFPSPNQQKERWAEIAHHGRQPTVHEQRLMHVIAGALDDGVFYTDDMFTWVCRALGEDFNPDDDPLTGKVVHGIRGMEIYYARRVVEAIRQRERDIAAASQIQVGQRFKNIYIAGKSYSTALVTACDVAGRVELHLTRRGTRRRWQVTIGAHSLLARAKEAKLLGT